MNESEVCRTCGHFVGTEKHQCDACRTEFRLRDQLAAATKRADDAEARTDHLSAHIQEISDALDTGWEGWKERGETKAQAIAAMRANMDKTHDELNRHLGGLEREQLLRDWESAVKGGKEWERLYKEKDKQLDAALEELRKREWHRGELQKTWCITCGMPELVGHAPSCDLAACLNGGAE